MTGWRKETVKVKRKQHRLELNNWDRMISVKSRLRPRTEKENVSISLGE